MRLTQLIQQTYPSLDTHPLADVEIRGVQEDSRRVRPGDLYIARPGLSTDGAAYIDSAKASGAVAVVSGKPIERCPLPLVVVPQIASAASLLANTLYGHPATSIKVIGITGTNGKTTTAYLVRHLLRAAGIKCGMIGTVETDDGALIQSTDKTTPDGGDVARLLAAMRDNGCAACVMETSSHALHQHRVDGVQFAAGAFTNLTGDHLDYHQTMDDYAAAKAILFEHLTPEAVAIVNGDDPYAARMLRDTRASVVRFGLNVRHDYHAGDVRISSRGSEFTLNTPAGSAAVKMKLIGAFNVENALTASAIVAETFNLTPRKIADALADASGAPGRLQNVSDGQAFSVLVDYAHTDDALENVLSSLRPLTQGKLRVLFGCGGERDPHKRPRMAAVAEKLADVVYITSDNPRGDSPSAIIEQIVAGLTDPSAAIIDPDRRSAIARVMRDARAGDVVVLAGKGHENYQLIGKQRLHFDDVEEAKKAIAQLNHPG